MHSKTPTQEMREQVACSLAPLSDVARDLRIGIMMHQATTQLRSDDLSPLARALLQARLEFLQELTEHPQLVDAYLPEEDNDPDSLYATRGAGITILSA